jgi:chitinase
MGLAPRTLAAHPSRAGGVSFAICLPCFYLLYTRAAVPAAFPTQFSILVGVVTPTCVTQREDAMKRSSSIALGLIVALSAVVAASIVAFTPPTHAQSLSRSAAPAARSGPSSKQIVAYFTEWGIYGANYDVKNIVTSGTAAKVTVINYAFSNISSSYQCQLADTWADYQKPFTADQAVNGVADSYGQPLAGNFNQLKELKALYPGLKIMISIGGWTESTNFSGAASPAHRAAFVQSCIDLFIKGNLPGEPGAAAGIFDGIDIDWEYPDNPGNGNPYGPQDITNYTNLLKEFDAQLDTLGKQTHQQYLLTTDTPAGVDKYGVLQLGRASHYVDWMNLLTYDMHGPWSATGPTDFNAPLFASPSDPSPAPSNQYSVNTAVRDYLDAGVPANKIVIGVPFYGHGWTNVPNANHGLYQSSPNIQPAALGGGTADYNVLVTQPGFTTYFDPVTQSDWIYDGTTFWSFDDPRMLAIKTQYVKTMRLGGVMYWSLDGDDASGTLATAIYNGLSA